MTPFLSRLVERAVPSTEPVLAARPVVPPLFGAGLPVEPAESAAEGDSTVPIDRPAPTAILSPPTLRPAAAAPPGRGESPVRAATPVEPSNRGERPFAVPVPRAAERPVGTDVPAAHATVGVRAPVAASPKPAHLVAGRPGQADPARRAIRTAPVTPLAPAMLGQLATHAQAAPVVRVTIGRIEVRAVTPPASVPARAPAPAARRTAIVLEDYLRGSAR